MVRFPCCGEFVFTGVQGVVTGEPMLGDEHEPTGCPGMLMEAKVVEQLGKMSRLFLL